VNNMNYSPPEKIPDGKISESDIEEILSRCPNITHLSIHNVGCLNYSICAKYLRNLKRFDVTESFQPLLTLAELKKILNYIDPRIEYEKKMYAEYIQENEILLKHYELNKEDLSDSQEDQLKFYLSYINPSSDDSQNTVDVNSDSFDHSTTYFENREIGTYQWYHSSYKIHPVIYHVCNVNPNLKEVSPGVYSS
jgi:hypothetical protein